jgi:voltage-gated potassium channel Kch
VSAPVHRAGLGARLRYRFDTTMSHGPGVIILWLFAATVAFVFLVAVVLTIFGVGVNEDTDPTLLERFWQAFLRILDPGTFSGDSGWPLRIAMLIVTLLGVLIGGSLIGLIVAAVDNRVEQLRRGRSLVVERDHTLVLGWSPRVFTLVWEIILANENQSRGCIVILADHEKPDMEEELRTRVPDTKNTSIVCRTGDPSSLQDLAMVNVTEARSVVALGSGDHDGISDAEAVKAALAVLSTDGGAGRRIVVELNDGETASALQDASAGRVVTVQAAEVISRITAQACRESGLSAVWRDLLDFEGDEIYFQAVPELVGHTFGEALLAFETSTIIGRRRADGVIAVHPPMDTVFGPGEEVVAVSEDDDTIVFSGFVDDGVAPPARDPAPPARPQRFLVVGWSHIGPVVLQELDQFSTPVSTIDVVADPALLDSDVPTDLVLRNLELRFQATHGNLERLAEHTRAHQYDKVVVLGYRRGLSPAEADARTLLTLLLLQGTLSPGPDGRRPPTVTELLDSGNVELARATGADDFVVSDELSSLMLAQLTERPDLEPVFADLFDVAGSAIALRPATSYVAATPTPFGTIVAAARARDEIAIGYRHHPAGGGPAVNVLNPRKSTMVTLGQDDKVVVIAPV